MSKIKNDGLDQYGAERFEQQQFGTAGVEWVKMRVENVMRNVNIRLTIGVSIISSSG